MAINEIVIVFCLSLVTVGVFSLVESFRMVQAVRNEDAEVAAWTEKAREAREIEYDELSKKPARVESNDSVAVCDADVISVEDTESIQMSQ